MTDIISALSKIQAEGVRFRSAVSEAVQQQIGANINYLVDFLSAPPGAQTIFTSSTTYVVPSTVHLLYVEVAGGGGGGGGGNTDIGPPTDYSGAGGSGSLANRTVMAVTPGASISVVVGAGGAGGGSGANGSAGVNSSFGSFVGLRGLPGVGHNSVTLNQAGLRGPVLGGLATGDYGISAERYDGGTSTVNVTGAGGGAGPGGAGGNGGTTTGGSAAANTGAGGAGGYKNTGSGGAGGSGYVKIVVII